MMILLYAVLFGCLTANAVLLRARGANEAHVFDYSKHGQDWLAGSCGSRTRQSPIDFANLKTGVANQIFKYNYERLTSPFKLKNTGQTLSAEFRGLGYGGINYADAWYELLYANVHAQSEHTFNGIHKPLELHLVHKRYDSDSLLLVAIPFDGIAPPPEGGSSLPIGGSYEAPRSSDKNFNPILQLFLKIDFPGPVMQVEVPGDEIGGPDLGELFAGASFHGYAGSTTAPPCAETAIWLVRSAPVMASDTQLRYLYDFLFANTGGLGNYRATMPLEGRDIILYSAAKEDAPVVPDDIADAVSPQRAADAEKRRSMKWAKDALQIAKASLDYVRNLDARVANASEAKVTILAPSRSGGVVAGAPSPAGADQPTSENAAVAMAATMAEVAKEAVRGASQRISEEIHDAAIAAARNATKMVLDNMRLHEEQVSHAQATAAFGR